MRQVVSGGGTWFSDRSRRVDFRPDGSPKTCSHDAAVAAQRARVGGVAWHRSPDRTFAHGILTFCGDDTHTLDMPAAPVDGNLQALAYARVQTRCQGCPRAVHLGARQQDGGTFASPASSCSGRRTASSTSSRHSESLKAQRLAMLQSGELPSWAPFRREQHTGAPPPHPFTTNAQQQLPPPPSGQSHLLRRSRCRRARCQPGVHMSVCMARGAWQSRHRPAGSRDTSISPLLSVSMDTMLRSVAIPGATTKMKPASWLSMSTPSSPQGT